jgi:hypothetical protein
LTVYALVTPGESGAPEWRARLAARVLDLFDRTIPVYVSGRLLSPTPRPEWGWVEGDDPRLRWNDFHDFAGTLELVTVSPADEFRLLPPSSMNRGVMQSALGSSKNGGVAPTCPFPRQ